MPGFQFFDVILLAMIAGFIGFRLYTVLGRRTGNERSPDERLRDSVTQPDTRAQAPAPETRPQILGGVSPAGPVARALMDMKLSDRHFDTDKFLNGARAAYEMIVTAYARGERDTLKLLVSDDVYQAFESGIRAREDKKERVEFTFEGLKSARVTGASLKERLAEITITFESDVTMVGYDPAGAVVEGSKTPNSVNDVWTFSRELGSRDPNWTLVSTAAG